MNTVIQFLLILLILTSCGQRASKQSPTSETILADSLFYKSVLTTKSILKPAKKEIIVTGKVVSDPDKTITYTPLVDGLVVRTYFSLGEKVPVGKVMLEVRSSELSALQSDIISSQADLTVAERDLRSAQTLYESNMLSEKEYLEAQAKYRQANATHEKNKADIGVYGVNMNGGMFGITAPMSGYVIAKNASPGSTVSAGSDPFFAIADLSSVWVIVNIYANNLQFVKEGMETEVTSVSYPNEFFKGKIEMISQVFDPEDRVLKARIILTNKDLKLKPEMSVMVKLKSQEDKHLVAIPSDAMIFDENNYYVVVREGGPGQFKVKKVEIYERNSQTVFLFSGLEADEDVVIRNQLLIYSELKGK